MTSTTQQAIDRYWREIFENATEPMLVIDQKGKRAHELNEALLNAVAAQKPSRILIDLSGLAHVVGEVVKLIRAVRILGTKAILVGIKPHLAQSLVLLGAGLEGVPTYATLEQGLKAAIGGRG